MRTRHAVLCLALAIPLPALAGYEEGIAAYRIGDYSTALAELHPLADQGNADAQWTLGLMYAQGSGVLQDYDELDGNVRKIPWNIASSSGKSASLYACRLAFTSPTSGSEVSEGLGSSFRS